MCRRRRGSGSEDEGLGGPPDPEDPPDRAAVIAARWERIARRLRHFARARRLWAHLGQFLQLFAALNPKRDRRKHE